ncbi:MAG: hypothetical protein HYY02_10455 [Chloroflexi bacterium]|nr:hypothetical protein [Chloroflexota bacterium]
MARGSLRQALGRWLRTLGFLLGAFGGSLRDNLSMGLLAVALSASIWVFITNEQNPPRTGIFPTRVPVQPVNVPTNLDVLGQLDPVVLRITAPTDLWNTMTENSFEVTVDLAEMDEGEAEVPVRARPRDGRVRILDIVPAQVRVRLDTLRRQVVPVRVNLQQGAPLGYAADLPRVEPAEVTILGPEGLVSLVDVAVADVNLSGARSTLRQTFPLVPRTARGYDIAGVRLEPQNAVVEVPVVRQINYVSLAVVAQLQGSPVSGYWVSQVRVDPMTVAVTGPQDVLQPLGALKTLPVEVSNLTAPVSRNVGIELPAGVALVDRSVVRVDVTVQPAQGTVVFQLAPQFLGLDTGRTAQPEVPLVEVTIGGEVPMLRDLLPERVNVFLNLGGRGPGVYPLEPEVRLPSGFRVIRLTPARLNVTLR